MLFKPKKYFARLLRRLQTPAEKKVWQALRNRKFLDLKFRRQHVFGEYIVDFYCDKLKLAIEIDGGYHLNQKEHDKLRQEFLEGYGISFVRVTNKEVVSDVGILLRKIEEKMSGV